MAAIDASSGPNQGRNLSRRAFVQTMAAPASALVFDNVPTSATSTLGATPVARFYQTLDRRQRKRLSFPFEHPLRTRVENHWAVTASRIAELTTEQQRLCHAIFKGLCSDDGHTRFLRQMNEDHGGFENYHVALFGEPGTTKPFEWVLTGRHNTLRADGNRHEGPGYGGPIFYGHAAEGHAPQQAPPRTGNVWWYQAEQADAVLRSLDEDQRARAFLTGRRGKLESPGLAVAEFDAAQKSQVRQLLLALIRPFRNFDAEAIQECLRDGISADRLRLSFFKAESDKADRAWDSWRLEGPAFTWTFHGTPHVHARLTLGRRAPRMQVAGHSLPGEE